MTARQTTSFFIFLFLIPYTLFPQTINISKNKSSEGYRIEGVVVDSLTSKAVQFCNFILYKGGNSPVSGAMTDSTGRFIVSGIQAGSYSAKISAVGYKSRRKASIIFDDLMNSQVLELDTIRLSQATISTGVVNVTASKERIQEQDDRIIINIDRSMGNNASEILENTPMVSVDINGSARLLGNPATQIYINGIPAKYAGYENTDDLKMLASSEVEKIELYANPTAQFAERTSGGIINIITKKTASSKYSASAGLSASTNSEYKANLGGSYSYEALQMRGSYSKNLSDFSSSRNTLKQISTQNFIGLLEQIGDSENETNAEFANLGISYSIDESSYLNLIGTYNTKRTDLWQNSFSSLRSELDITENSRLIDKYSNRLKSNTLQKYFTLQLGFKRTFEEKGRSLRVNAAINNNTMDLNNGSEINKEIPASQMYWQSSSSNNTNFFQRYNISYHHPVIQDYKVDLIYNATIKRLTLDNKYGYVFNPDDQLLNLKYTPKISNRYFDMDHYFYGSFKGTTWGITHETGLSYEKYVLESEDVMTMEKFNNDFSSINPYLQLSRKIAGSHTVNLIFLNKCTFPFNKQLNPHVDNSDSTDIKAGNPFLKPFYSNDYIIDYRYGAGSLFFRLGLDLYSADGVIEQITYQKDVRTAVTTYKNVAKLNSWNAVFYAAKSFGSWLKVEPIARYCYKTYEGESANSKGGVWMGELKAALSSSIFKFQLSLVYSSSEIYAQSKQKENFYASAALKALFFDRRLSVTLRATDIFNTKDLGTKSHGAGFIAMNNIRQTTRVISFDISYFFQSKAPEMLDEPMREEYGDDF